MNAPSTTLDAVLNAKLDELRAADLYRTRRIVERHPAPVRGTHAVIDGRECVTFCSNDYLGLAQHPEVVEAFARVAREHGVGSGASHLVTGHHALHHALEEQLAAWTGRERALLFSTGYMANLAVATALTGPDDTVLEDRLNHASLLDGGRLSRARFERYPHADAAALEAALASCTGGHALVLTDGVFSMDGDLAPLPALAAACRQHGGWLAVDDAHGLGVLGPTGRGTLEYHGMGAEDVPVLVGTLGKALGTFGAFVAGSRALIEFLVQRARTHIYTTALPPAVAAATSAALAVAAREAWRRERVLAHAARFREAAAALGLPLRASTTPIQPVILGSARAALAASAALMQRGLLVTAIRPPTVPPGTSRLRVTFSAEHTDADVDRLIEALAALPRADAAA